MRGRSRVLHRSADYAVDRTWNCNASQGECEARAMIPDPPSGSTREAPRCAPTPNRCGTRRSSTSSGRASGPVRLHEPVRRPTAAARIVRVRDKELGAATRTTLGPMELAPIRLGVHFEAEFRCAATQPSGRLERARTWITGVVSRIAAAQPVDAMTDRWHNRRGRSGHGSSHLVRWVRGCPPVVTGHVHRFAPRSGAVGDLIHRAIEQGGARSSTPSTPL